MRLVVRRKDFIDRRENDWPRKKGFGIEPKPLFI